MQHMSHRIFRVAPVVAAVAAPALYASPRERRLHQRGSCHCAQKPQTWPKHLIDRIDNVYKNWGGYGFADKYEIVGVLGSGGFGKVYKARVKGRDRFRAVKKIGKSEADEETLRNEVQCLLELDHPHIVKLIRYYEEKDHFVLIFELCDGPDLFDAIDQGLRAGGRICEKDAALWFRHMLKALRCCHSKYIGHFDIKPENFMFQTSKTTSGSNLKMIDLGLGGRYCHGTGRLIGTKPYMAPEVYRGVHGPEADVWSCGVVLFLMLTGREFIPTDDLSDEEIAERVSDRDWVAGRLKLAQRAGVTPLAYGLLRQLLCVDRHMRIPLQGALKHPFVTGSYNISLQSASAMREAVAVLDNLEDSIRQLSARPMLTRAGLKLTVHLVSTDIDDMAPQRLAFRMLDRAGYGELSIDALEESMKLNSIPTSGRMGQLFKIIDTNRDGYISFTDFLVATLPPSVRNNEEEFVPAFVFFDRNNDGFIDADDLVSALGFTKDEDIQLCREAIQEVTVPPHRLSLDAFLRLFRDE